MKCFISGPANQNSQLWLSWSQQYNLEILYRKYQIDFMYLLNKYSRTYTVHVYKGHVTFYKVVEKHGHVLPVILYFITLYCFEKRKDEEKISLRMIARRPIN